MSRVPRIALSSGEPAGVGPDLCLAVAARKLPCELVFLGDRELFAERATRLGASVEGLNIEHHALGAPCTPGILDKQNSWYVLKLIDRAIDGALAGEFDALVTAPVHKGIINDAGIAFTGHTEYLAERTRAKLPVMMLATTDLRVALATTHLPLKQVSAAITVDSLCEVLDILNTDLKKWWNISTPRITVCGLNPHAGEGGYLGDEEIKTITPAITRMRALGLNINGPVPADTAFVPAKLAECDAVLAMYHDQGLPVIKHSGFDRAVNITLGLPILRTSVDHGTALDLAGTGRADPSSLIAAIELAVSIVNKSQ